MTAASQKFRSVEPKGSIIKRDDHLQSREGEGGVRGREGEISIVREKKTWSSIWATPHHFQFTSTSIFSLRTLSH